MKKGLLVAALLAVVSVAKAQVPADAIYGIKSGKVTTSMDMMGQSMESTLYFDDYGKKQATVSNFGGGESRSIVVDGETIMINDAEKTAIKMPSFGGFGGGRQATNYLNLTDEVMKQNNMKLLGTETIAGKECKKYSMEMEMMGMTQSQTIWLYQGITMKTSSESDFGSMERTVTKIEENVAIAASMFTIPEGVKVEEMDMSQMMGGGF